MSRRVRGGRLHRLHRGVYAVGQARLSFDGRCMAAVLACGDGTVVSHGSAAGLWLLLSPASGPIHVTVPGDGGRKRRRGIINHRSPTFVARFATRRDGVPVTKPPRTLRDLHRTVPEPVYRRAVRRALDLRLISSEELRSGEDLNRSKLERMMVRLCRGYSLPKPDVNARVDKYEVDFIWREHRVNR